ncbi:MAG: response regulator [Deltaproteobacteria bacterium]|nr:response regulator [Deltaproteobacteria bacterium]
MLVNVVDDEATIRMLVTYILRSLGHTVETFASVDACLASHARKTPDLVLTDLIMPDKDGAELCRRLRENEATRDTKVIIMSGFELDRTGVDTLCNELHVAEIVMKPFFAETLIEAIRRATHSAPAAASDAVTAPRSPARPLLSSGKRLQPRFNIALPVTVAWGNEELRGVSENIGTNGLLIFAERAPPIMEEVELHIDAAAPKGPVVLHATVAHVQGQDQGRTGFGLALREQSMHAYYYWYRLLASIHREHREAISANLGRRAARVPVTSPARLDHRGGTVDASIGDISVGGIRVLCEALLDSTLTVHFNLPGADSPVASPARVRWMQRQFAGRYTYGLAFATDDPARTLTIRRHVDAVVRAC